MSTLSMRALGAAVIGAAALWGCTSQRSSPPFAGGLPNLNTAKRAHGEVVFMQNCNQCHPSDAGGLGPALNNKPAPATAIKAVVRIGPGDMPSFGDADLSDADVDAVADYVVALREADDEAEDAREGD